LTAGIEIYLIGGIDKDKKKARLLKDQATIMAQIASLESRLNSEEFKSKAPEQLVAKQTLQLTEARNNLTKIEEALNLL
jgi:valyl-tRNA synthetase